MSNSEQLASFASGAFFLVALLCGGWKYAQIRKSPTATANNYVNIAHRAGFLYAFSCHLLVYFLQRSGLDEAIKMACVVGLLTYFFIAQAGYIVHGWLADTDNQFEKPHQLGKKEISPRAMGLLMFTLFAVECLAFAIIFIAGLL